MKEYRIILQPQFLGELEVILYSFPSTKLARRKLYIEVKNTVLNLSIFPERYNQISQYKKFRTNNIRKLPINKYVVIYEIDNKKDEVYILHIFSQKQDYLNQL